MLVGTIAAAAAPWTRRDQQSERRRGRGRGRSQREQRDPEDEHALTAEQVGDPACRQQEGRKQNRVRVDHPRQRFERRVREAAGDVREGRIDDRDVDERHEGGQTGD
jgi:hypothetical protein